MKLDILAIGAHPDDVEFGCGGTLLKLISEGKKVGVVDLTEGELGTLGNRFTRAEEAKRAAGLMGISVRENLRMKDGFLEDQEDYKMRVVQIIRKYQPDIILCNALEDRHPDHGKAAKLVSDACFLSGLLKVETRHNEVSQKAWRPGHVFHYIQWENLKPDFVIDITGFIDQKIEVCSAYKTQLFDPDSSETVITYTSTKNFRESLFYRSRDLGRLSGVDYAEGFNVERLLSLKNFDGIVG